MTMPQDEPRALMYPLEVRLSLDGDIAYTIHPRATPDLFNDLTPTQRALMVALLEGAADVIRGAA